MPKKITPQKRPEDQSAHELILNFKAAVTHDSVSEKYHFHKKHYRTPIGLLVTLIKKLTPRDKRSLMHNAFSGEGLLTYLIQKNAYAIILEVPHDLIQLTTKDNFEQYKTLLWGRFEQIRYSISRTEDSNFAEPLASKCVERMELYNIAFKHTPDSIPPIEKTALSAPKRDSAPKEATSSACQATTPSIEEIQSTAEAIRDQLTDPNSITLDITNSTVKSKNNAKHHKVKLLQRTHILFKGTNKNDHDLLRSALQIFKKDGKNGLAKIEKGSRPTTPDAFLIRLDTQCCEDFLTHFLATLTRSKEEAAKEIEMAKIAMAKIEMAKIEMAKIAKAKIAKAKIAMVEDVEAIATKIKSSLNDSKAVAHTLVGNSNGQYTLEFQHLHPMDYALLYSVCEAYNQQQTTKALIFAGAQCTQDSLKAPKGKVNTEDYFQVTLDAANPNSKVFLDILRDELNARHYLKPDLIQNRFRILNNAAFSKKPGSPPKKPGSPTLSDSGYSDTGSSPAGSPPPSRSTPL